MTPWPGTVITMSVLTKTLVAGAVGASVIVGAPISASASGSAKVTFELPAPTGRHQVGTRALHLVDANRQDPWKPDRKRELMVSVWYPAANTGNYPSQQWVPDGVAGVIEDFVTAPPANVPKGAVDWTSARSAGHVGAPPARGKRPVVLYSPGFEAPRAFGTTAAQDLASHGYIVVTIDHTYEVPVEFPGGRVEKSVGIKPEQMAQALDARVRDTRFVLDELADQAWLKRFADLGRVGMFGHSYGGFTAAEAMLRDRRIDAGTNMDGSMSPEYGEVAEEGLDRPFFLMGGQVDRPDGSVVDQSPFTDEDPSWHQFWANQKGPKQSVVVTGARHLSFSDLQPILPQLTKPLDLPADHFKLFIGPIDPARSVAWQHTDIRCFFDRYL